MRESRQVWSCGIWILSDEMRQYVVNISTMRRRWEWFPYNFCIAILICKATKVTILQCYDLQSTCHAFGGSQKTSRRYETWSHWVTFSHTEHPRTPKQSAPDSLDQITRNRLPNSWPSKPHTQFLSGVNSDPLPRTHSITSCANNASHDSTIT